MSSKLDPKEQSPSNLLGGTREVEFSSQICHLPLVHSSPAYTLTAGQTKVWYVVDAAEVCKAHSCLYLVHRCFSLYVPSCQKQIFNGK